MKIEYFAEYLFFRLDGSDFRTDEWKSFLEEVREKIGLLYREYDPDSSGWIIWKPAWPIFQEIYKRYYIGDNQKELDL